MSSYLFDYKLDFSGGEHDAISPDNIRQNEVIEMINFDPDISGGVTQRSGTVNVNQTINTRKNRIVEFEFLSGATRSIKRLELIDNKIVDPDTPQGAYSYKILYSNVGEAFDYEVFNNKLYILTGTDYLVYDGTTIVPVTNALAGSMLSDVKKCRYLIKKGDRMIFAGHSDKPNYVLYSERLDPTYVKDASGSPATTINPVVALSDDGDVITGLETFNDNIIIFKRRSIFAISGVDPMTQWVLKRLNTHTGTISHRTVEKVSNSLIFLGYDKRLYRLFTADSGEVAVQHMSLNKDASLEKIVLPTDPALATVHSIYYEGKYILSAPTGTDYKQNDTLFVFHFLIWQKTGGQECWSRYAGLNISDMIITNDGTLYLAKVAGGYTVKLDKSALTDSGEPISTKIQIKSFNGVRGNEERGNALHIKKFKSLKVLFRQFEAESSSVKVYRRVDYDDDNEELYTLSADQAGIYDEGDFDESLYDFNDVSIGTVPIGKRGIKCVIIIYSDDTVPNNKIVLYGVGVKYRLKKLR